MATRSKFEMNGETYEYEGDGELDLDYNYPPQVVMIKRVETPAISNNSRISIVGTIPKMKLQLLIRMIIAALLQKFKLCPEFFRCNTRRKEKTGK